MDPTTRVPAGRLQAYLNCEIIRLNEQLDENVEEKVIQIVTGDGASIHPEDRSSLHRTKQEQKPRTPTETK